MNKIRRLRQSSQYFRRYGRGLLSVLLLVGCAPEQLLDVSLLPVPSSTPSSTATPSPSTNKPESFPTPSPNVHESPTFKFPHTDTLIFHDDIRHPTPRQSESPLPEPSVEPTSPVGEPSSPPATPTPTITPDVGSLEPSPTPFPLDTPTPTPLPTPVETPVPSPSSTPEPIVLSIPQNFKSVSITDSSFTLQWDSVTDATAYDISVKKDGQYVTSFSVWGETTALVKNLSPGRQYQCTVLARKPNVNPQLPGSKSPPSEPITVLTKPSIPGGLKAISATDTHLSLIWNPVYNPNFYNIYSNNIKIAGQIQTESYVVPMNQNTSYLISITAENDSGESTKGSESFMLFPLVTINDEFSDRFSYRLVRNATKRFDFNVKAGRSYKVLAKNTNEDTYLYLDDVYYVGEGKYKQRQYIWSSSDGYIEFRAEQDGVKYIAITDNNNTSGSDGQVRVISYDEPLEVIPPNGGTLTLNNSKSFSLVRNGISRYKFNITSGVDYKITTSMTSGDSYIYLSKIASVDQYVKEFYSGYNWSNTQNALTFRAWETGTLYIALKDDNNINGSTGTITLTAQ